MAIEATRRAFLDKLSKHGVMTFDDEGRVVWGEEAVALMRTRSRADLIDGYHREHAACPQCGSDSFEQTCMGFIIDKNHPERYQDRNRATCMDCGWEGIVHELVPEALKDE